MGTPRPRSSLIGPGLRAWDYGGGAGGGDGESTQIRRYQVRSPKLGWEAARGEAWREARVGSRPPPGRRLLVGRGGFQGSDLPRQPTGGPPSPPGSASRSARVQPALLGPAGHVSRRAKAEGHPLDASSVPSVGVAALVPSLSGMRPVHPPSPSRGVGGQG